MHLTDMIITMLNFKQFFTTLEIVPVGKNRVLFLVCGLWGFYLFVWGGFVVFVVGWGFVF